MTTVSPILESQFLHLCVSGVPLLLLFFCSRLEMRRREVSGCRERKGPVLTAAIHQRDPGRECNGWGEMRHLFRPACNGPWKEDSDQGQHEVSLHSRVSTRWVGGDNSPVRSPDRQTHTHTRTHSRTHARTRSHTHTHARMRGDTLCVVTNFSLHGVTVKRST